MRSYAGLPCIEHDGQQFSYARLCDDYEAWVDRLRGSAIAPGTVVALRADYSLSAIALLLALLSRRAVVAMLPRSGNVEDYLLDSRASLMLDLNLAGTLEVRDCLPAQAHPLLERLRDLDDGGLVLFSSGSTGRPKAALHSLHRFLYKFQVPGRRFRTLAFLIFDHIAGMDTLFYTLGSGGVLIVPRQRDPDAICALIEAARVEVLPASPSFLRLLCMGGGHTGRNVSSLKIITYGSERMDEGTLRRLSTQFPDVRLIQKYGTTETGSPRTISRGNDSLWVKFRGAGVRIKVIEGVLWLHCEGSILGYLNAANSVGEDGWYCTGDLVAQDGEWLRFVGRTADLINVGGEKVSPAEVEAVILLLEFVVHVAVSGEPHALLGQIVRAELALAQGCEPREALRLIRAHCRANLASYKVPMKIEVVAGGLGPRLKAPRSSATG